MRAFGLVILTAASILACGQSSLRAKEASSLRKIQYSFVKAEVSVTVTVQEKAAGPDGDVAFTGGSMKAAALLHVGFDVSRTDFEQMWSTLNASGVVKRPVTDSKMDLTDDLVFKTGSRMYYIGKTSFTPAVSALSSRLRKVADQAMAGFKKVPRASVTKLEVIDHGIYDGIPVTSSKKASDYHLVKQTDTVPIRAGSHYGVRYRLIGSRPGFPVDITYEFTFPRSQDENTGRWSTDRREHYTIVTGQIFFAGLLFRNETDYAQGENKIRIFVGSKLMLEQMFHLLPP